MRPRNHEKIFLDMFIEYVWEITPTVQGYLGKSPRGGWGFFPLISDEASIKKNPTPLGLFANFLKSGNLAEHPILTNVFLHRSAHTKKKRYSLYLLTYEIYFKCNDTIFTVQNANIKY